MVATVKLRGTRWSPYRNADDGNQPNLCAATRKSRRVNQSSLNWSRHTASTATTSCPRYCFMAMPHRHRLDCFVFCDRSLQRKHRFATFFLTEVFSAQDLGPFLMTAHSFHENSRYLVHLGKWLDPRRNALDATRSPLPEIVDLCGARHDLGRLPV